VSQARRSLLFAFSRNVQLRRKAISNVRPQEKVTSGSFSGRVSRHIWNAQPCPVP
jgi:hypothetical protein